MNEITPAEEKFFTENPRYVDLFLQLQMLEDAKWMLEQRNKCDEAKALIPQIEKLIDEQKEILKPWLESLK